MPVRKFRSVEDVPEWWYQPGDPMLFRAMARLWRLGRATLQLHFPPGVYKHRSIEEMNQQQEAWDQANFLAFQARREKEVAMSKKTKLKELHDQGALPPVSYTTRRVGGTDHEPAWDADARLDDGRSARGVGHSKKEAEENAAAALDQRHKLLK